MRFLTLRNTALASLLLLAAAIPALAGNWPQWRGPSGDGVSDDTKLPLKWDEKTNIVWKCPLPEGASTPCIWSDAIFLTAMDGEKLFFLRINKTSGKVEWSKEVGSGTMRRGSPKRKEHTFHNLHNMASPSPVTDGERVIIHFGNGDLTSYDFDGKQQWTQNLQKDHGGYSIWWGHANSPVIWKDLVISVCMQDPLDDLQKVPAESYLVAHDKKTGTQKWKVMRMTGSKSEDADSYTTPLLRTVDGKDEFVISGANQIDAYDPTDGKQVWVLPNIKGSRTITGPVLGDGLVFAAEGKKGALLAIKPGKGKLGADAVVWKKPQSNPDTPCPVYWKGLLYVITDDGFAQCVDAKTGEVHYKERLPGDYKASLLVADGKVYCLNMAGKCTVLATGTKFQKLAENQLEEPATSASMAASDGKIFVRGKKALYCIGTK